ncbi:hypothetical protein M407DRAFT_246327 [Tulasnella calospora MUT 4182]|uniref:Uncharacterized protein n=1 Tax=Tulasnella calospora MUT 4182 TaxID=1051891 RepID=A0A0C3Q5R2_9AGAM|nr:hypothetical protein M407DRAFT_246327 [Tulasnella calospora MUT 4182]
MEGLPTPTVRDGSPAAVGTSPKRIESGKGHATPETKTWGVNVPAIQLGDRQPRNS